MIEDLVDVTRFESGQLHLELQPVSLPAFLADWLKRMQTALAVERIVIDLPADLPAVLADYNRLERIVTNLLSNALKYSDGPVRVSAAPRDGLVEVSVSDQGRGIHPDDLPHLFERFYRVKGGWKAEGVGLGLYITKLLVEAHAVPSADGKTRVGGRIWVDSEPGAGSTFHFTLPVASP